MPVSLGSPSLFAHKTVSPADIAAAVADVKAAGVAEATIRPLVDAFASANREGRVSATSRKAFEAALFGLVQDLPRTPSSVLVRRDEASLTSSIQQAQTVIGKQTTRIAGLEAEVQTLSTSLTAKTTEAQQLLTTQQDLATALSSSLSKQESNVILSAFMLMFSNGASAMATNMVTINGVKAALSVGEIKAKQADVARQISATSSTITQLTSQIAVVNETVATQRQALDGLQLLETSLRAQVAAMPAPTSTATLAERLTGLSISLEVHQALSSNLGKQIDVLETMKAGLTTTNTQLDALIAGLKLDNDGLRAEIASSERAIKSTLIDLALSMSNVPKNFQIGALDLSTKTLLLDGVEGLRLSMLGQAHAMARDFLTSTALGVPSSSPIGRLFLAALDNDPAGVQAATSTIVDAAATDALANSGFSGASGQMLLSMLKNDLTGVRQAALDGVLDNVDSLTSTQRNLIEQLLFAPRTAAKPLDSDLVLQIVTRVAADPSIDDKRARGIANAVITTDGAAVLKMRDPALESLELVADVRLGQATPKTSYLALWDANDGHLARLSQLSVESLCLVGDTTVTAAGLQVLTTLPTLTSMRWGGVRASGDQVEAIASVSTLQKLELNAATADLKHLATLPVLSTLKLELATVHGDASLAALSTLPALTKLEAPYSALTGSGIAASGLATRLDELNLQGTTQGAADLAALATMPNLKELGLAFTRCGEADLLQLAASTSLQQVRLTGCAVDVQQLNAAVGRTLFV